VEWFVRGALVVGGVVVLWSGAGFLRGRVFPGRCRKCGCALGEQATCVYLDEDRGRLVMPKISLVVVSCPRGGYEHSRRLALDGVSGTVFASGSRARWAASRDDSAEVARANVRDMMEWDNILLRIEKEHRAKLVKRKSTCVIPLSWSA